MKRILTILAILLVTLGLLVPAFAQYVPPETQLEQLVTAMLAQDAGPGSRTLLAITVNNIADNLLLKGDGEEEVFDEDGYPIVSIAPGQKLLPVVGSLPPGLFTFVTLGIEDTDFEWTVRVDANGLFLTNLPLPTLPAGEYRMTLNGVVIFTFVLS